MASLLRLWERWEEEPRSCGQLGIRAPWCAALRALWPACAGCESCGETAPVYAHASISSGHLTVESAMASMLRLCELWEDSSAPAGKQPSKWHDVQQ